MAAFRARTSLQPLSEPLLQDVRTIGRPAGLWIESFPDVLKHGFLVTEILARLPIELPQDAVLAHREHEVLVVVVDQHALEDDVEIQ